MKEEIWKDIEGFEGLYQVSSFGRVKSLPRNGTVCFPNILKPGKDSTVRGRIRRGWRIEDAVQPTPSPYVKYNYSGGDKL